MAGKNEQKILIIGPAWVGVEARDHLELFAAGLDEGFTHPHVDLLDGLETIGNEGGTDDLEFFDALLGKAFGGRLRRWLEPRVIAKA